VKAPTLYHGTTSKKLKILLQDNQFPSVAYDEVAGNLTPSIEIAKSFAKNIASKAECFGEEKNPKPVVVVFKPTAVTKAKFRPVLYTLPFYKKHEKISDHILSAYSDVWEGEDLTPAKWLEEMKRAVKDLKKEQEWVSLKNKEPIKPHIEKIIKV